MLIRTLIDGITRVLGVMTRRRRIAPQALPGSDSVKVNLGCGLAVASGWWNVDASLNALIAGWPSFLHRITYRASGSSRYYSEEQYRTLLRENRFVHHDLGDSIPFQSSTVDYVYTSHFLEHLFEKEGAQLLREACRVLRPGGTIRVCVPDLAYAVELYRQGHKEQMLRDYFFVEDMGSYLARHKYMYDFELLSKVLLAAGFQDVTRCGYRQGTVPDIELLDNRPDETLFVEARRPAAIS